MSKGTIFDPTVKPPKEFTRKRKIYLLLIAVVASYLISEYILMNTTRINIFNINGKRITNGINIEVESLEEIIINFRIDNYSPYKVSLYVNHDGKEGIIVTSNAVNILDRKTSEYYWVKIINNSASIKSVSIEIGGTKT